MILSEPLDTYLQALHRDPDAVLRDMRDHGDREDIPIVHATTGALLEVLASHTPQARIVEVGTAIGVSTFHLARAGGQVTSFEIDEERHEAAKAYLERAGLSADLRLQDATEGLQTLQPPFDLGFIDGPKAGYGEHMQLIVELLRPGGMLIVDNVLVGGGAATGTATGPWTQEQTDEMRSFNERLLEHPDLRAKSILPVGDGVALAIKR